MPELSTVLDDTTFAVRAGGTARSEAQRWGDLGVNVRDFGAIGDGTRHPIKNIYANLAAAQVDFPNIDELGNQDLDGLAIQKAVDYMLANLTASAPRTVILGCGGYISSLPLYFDPVANLRGGLTADKWDIATTYAEDDVVVWNGVLWKSLADGNVGAKPYLPRGLGDSDHFAGDIIVYKRQYYRCKVDGAQWHTLIGTGGEGPIFNASFWEAADPPAWLPTTATPTIFNRGIFVEGDGGLPTGQSAIGSRITFLFNNAKAFWMPTGNGNRLCGVQIYGFPDAGAYGYRGGQPNTGTGLCIPGGDAGASRTTIERVEVFNFYTAAETGANQDTLADSNRFVDFNCASCFNGMLFGKTQNFINSIYGGTIGGTRSLVSDVGGGCHAYGTNLSTGNGGGVSGAFEIESVSAITSTAHGNNFRYTIDVVLVDALDDYLLAGVLDRANLATARHGVTAWDITGVDAGTRTVSLSMRLPEADLYYPTLNAKTATSLEADLQDCVGGDLYSVEWISSINGSGITIDGTHIENANAAGALINSGSGFGDNRANALNSVIYNYDPALPNWRPSNSPTAAQLAMHYAAATMGIITVDNTDLSIQNSNMVMQTSRCPIDFPSDTQSARFVANMMRGFRPNLRAGGNGGFSFFGGMGEQGSSSCGAGEFDTDPHGGHSTDDVPFRQSGWGQTHYRGYRPSHDVMLTVASSHYDVVSGTLPAITHSGSGSSISYAIGYPRLWGRRPYQIINLPDNASQTVFQFVSKHKLKSLGQDLTTTNIPNLSYTYRGQSSFVYANIELLRILEAGDCVGLFNGSIYVYYEVTGVYETLGYFTVTGTASTGDTSRLSGDKDTDFTGTTVKMPVFDCQAFAMVA